MKITLSDIEKAVRANFLLKKDGKKLLEVEDNRKRCLGAARIVFVGVALANTHRQEEICEYLDMTVTDFNSKVKRFRKLFEGGVKKISTRTNTKARTYDENWNLEIDIYIYRKTVLVKNYLASLQREALVFL